MTNHSHMPPIPPANQSKKGATSDADAMKDNLVKETQANPNEQGETANIRQNTTNKGYFEGRKKK